MSGQDQCIGVGRVSNNKGFDISVGIFIDSSALRNENFSIFLQKVTSLHTFSSWFCTHQKSSFYISES